MSVCLRAQCAYPDGFTRNPAPIKDGRCSRCGALYPSKPIRVHHRNGDVSMLDLEREVEQLNDFLRTHGGNNE